VPRLFPPAGASSHARIYQLVPIRGLGSRLRAGLHRGCRHLDQRRDAAARGPGQEVRTRDRRVAARGNRSPVLPACDVRPVDGRGHERPGCVRHPLRRYDVRRCEGSARVHARGVAGLPPGGASVPHPHGRGALVDGHGLRQPLSGDRRRGVEGQHQRHRRHGAAGGAERHRLRRPLQERRRRRRLLPRCRQGGSAALSRGRHGEDGRRPPVEPRAPGLRLGRHDPRPFRQADRDERRLGAQPSGPAPLAQTARRRRLYDRPQAVDVRAAQPGVRHPHRQLLSAARRLPGRRAGRQAPGRGAARRPAGRVVADGGGATGGRHVPTRW
jgi:hypothetical protein